MAGFRVSLVTVDFTIRDMVLADIDRVVLIHRDAFPGFFLTRMGPRFLRAYYTAVLEFPDRIALIAEEAGAAVGFAVGFANAPRFYADFARRRRRLLPMMVLAVLRRPALAIEILRNSKRVEAEATGGGDSEPQAVELSSIATLGRGGGIGGRLLAGFVDAAIRTGGRSIVLTTDAAGNDAVRQFYERRGFELEAQETRGARVLCRYRRSLIAG